MLEAITRRLKHNMRGISNVIVVMLSLILIVIIVGNVVLWSYQMNQLDWERTEEDISIVNVERIINGSRFSFENKGALTSHIISLWVNNATNHQHYDVDIFVNSGENATYTAMNMPLPTGNFMVKVVTERGNIAVLTNQ